jgi:hypothetical protein
LQIAAKWGATLDAEQLEVALKALEPQLQREHAERMFRLEMQQEAAQQSARSTRDQREHKRYMAGLISGTFVALGMLVGGLLVAKDQWWLSILLCGPSLLALVKIFVLRRSDEYDMKVVTQAMRSAMGAAGQAQPPPPPPVA